MPRTTACTKAGRRQLGEETAQWNRIAIAIAKALEPGVTWRCHVSLMSRMRSLWRNLAHGKTVEKDLDDELRDMPTCCRTSIERAAWAPRRLSVPRGCSSAAWSK